jgi:hypothetical protein
MYVCARMCGCVYYVIVSVCFYTVESVIVCLYVRVSLFSFSRTESERIAVEQRHRITAAREFVHTPILAVQRGGRRDDQVGEDTLVVGDSEDEGVEWKG